jgi:hypothetical protein
LWRGPAVLSWAGARGVVPLAAALSLPLTDAAGVPIPYRDLLQAVAATVIVISLIVQGSQAEQDRVRPCRRAGPGQNHQEQHDRREHDRRAGEPVAGACRQHAGRDGHRDSTQLRRRPDRGEAKIADLRVIASTLRAALDAGCDDLMACAGQPCCPIPFATIAVGPPDADAR